MLTFISCIEVWEAQLEKVPMEVLGNCVVIEGYLFEGILKWDNIYLESQEVL